MSNAQGTKVLPSRMGAISWGLWAERAVVRALEIDPNHQIEPGVLGGQPTCDVALTIARAIGYLAGTQRAPDLPARLRAWLDQVAMVSDGAAVVSDGPAGARLGGLSWGQWAERAAVMALEIAPETRLEGVLLPGQPLWEVAITVARAIGGLAGARSTWGLPAAVCNWLQGTPAPAMTRGQDMPSKEEAR